MINTYRVLKILVVCVAVLPVFNVHAKQWSFESSVDARAEYNDNIFLTDQEHDSVAGLIITPSLSGIIKERHWQVKLNAMIKSQNYSIVRKCFICLKFQFAGT